MDQNLKTIIGIFLVLLAQCAGAESPDGVDAFNKKDYVTAMKKLQPLAEQGNAAAQYYVGLIFDADENSLHDHAKALQWYLKSATQGYADAQYNSGARYLSQALDKARIPTSAKGELDPARIDPELFGQAFQWMLKAAEQGVATAQSELAEMYHEGWGVQRNYNKAMEWDRRAVEQGWSLSFLSLASMYEKGEGVPKNRVIADALYHLEEILEAKDTNADDEPPNTENALLRNLENKMSPQELSVAEKLTGEMNKPGNLLNAMDQYGAHPTVKEKPIYSPADNKASLCKDSEDILFSCVTRAKLISVCASKDLTSTNGYIQYRTEANGKLEFEFPQSHEHPSKIFTFMRTTGAHGGTAALRFKNGEYTYVTWLIWDRTIEDQGVTVKRNGKSIASLACLDNVIGDWSEDDKIKAAGIPEPTPPESEEPL